MRIIAIVGVGLMIFLGACKSSSAVSSASSDAKNEGTVQQEDKSEIRNSDGKEVDPSSNGVVKPIGVSTQSGGMKKRIPIKKSSSGGN
tara:strand:+ start:161 stop:424 length:264 start_codon:yes stop_codon:yes gene_type:complete